MTSQKHLFTGRWRGVLPDPKEFKIQIAVVAECRWRLRPDVLMLSIPNEEADKARAAKKKAMGALAGAADLLFAWSDTDGLHNLWLELKRSGGVPSLAQMQFLDAVRAVGGFYEIAHGADEAIAVIAKYNLLKGR
jgi:hypothetical protein